MQFELIDMIIAIALAAIVVFTPLLDPPLGNNRESKEERHQRRREDFREFKGELKKEIIYLLSQDLDETAKALGSAEDDLEDAGTEEDAGADALLEIKRKGRDAVIAINTEKQQIRQETVKKLLDRISEGVQALIKNAEYDPNDVSSTKAFFRKYLEPTCKLAHSYAAFSKLKKKNAEVEKGMANIEAMLRDVADAFEVKLVDLHQNDVLDIQSDISAMRTMLAREGLVEDDKRNLTLRAGH